MKNFEELSNLGRIRRIRGLAQLALDAYGLSNTRIKFLRQAGNTIFRIHEIKPKSSTKDNLYVPGQYMLRVHQHGYQTPEAIELELAWLASMRRDANLPVPEPVPTLDGKLFTRVLIPGIPEERICSLLRWIKGRSVVKNIRSCHFKAQGQLMAGLHNHASHWDPPANLSKRKYDWVGLFMEGGGAGIPASEAWSLLPQKYVKPFEIVSSKMKVAMDGWGKSPNVYGLIHGDLGLDANVLFCGKEALAIDFDDSGFGYYIYDLSLALEHCQEDVKLPRFREALLDGYTRIRLLPEEQLKHIDLCLASFWVFWSLWAVAEAQCNPKYRKILYKRMDLYYKRVERFIARN
ncbi:phosphotransferase [candidate division WOR-3 bacterium]|nr:phosphotransferase [candidate division WOR-3 bacterium]